jgi:hypothetical protein
MTTKGHLDKSNQTEVVPPYVEYKLFGPTLRPRSTKHMRVPIWELACFHMDLLPVNTRLLPPGVTLKVNHPSPGIVSFVFSNSNDHEVKPPILKICYVARSL